MDFVMIDHIIKIFCKEITNLKENRQIVSIYKRYLSEYPNFKDYVFIVGTNDKSFISQDLLCQIFDLTYDKFSIKSPLSNYKYILILDKNIDKKDKQIDISIYVDSNSLGLFIQKDQKTGLYKAINNNPISDFVIKNNLDINPMLYINEDFWNINHTYSQDIQKEQNKYDTKIKKLKALFEFQNYDIKDPVKLEQIVDYKMHFFTNNYIGKNCENFINIDGSPIYIDKNNKDYFVNFNGYKYLNHTFIYSYLLLMFILSFKKTSYQEKFIEFVNITRKYGPMFLNLLSFAYEYFKNKTQVDKFMNFDLKQWSFERIRTEASNKAWDIFNFYEIENTSLFKQDSADAGIGLFLSGDTDFISSFIKNSKKRILIVNQNKRILTGYNSNMQHIDELVQNLSCNLKQPRYMKDKNLISLSLLLKNIVDDMLIALKENR